MSEESFLKYFANGVEPRQAKVLYAVQQPTAASLFGERTTAAAWHSKPSWYAVSKLDQTINPDLERFLAKRMNATTVELEAGHLSLVSHGRQIADLILAAAGHKKLPSESARGGIFVYGVPSLRGAEATKQSHSWLRCSWIASLRSQ